MYDPKRIAVLEQEWEEIEKSYRLTHYNAPINREEEYQKVRAAYDRGQSYDPQFVYLEPPDFPVQRIRQFMARLQPDHNPLEKLYYEKARYEQLAIQAVQTHDPAIITASSILVNGIPDNSLLTEAHRILKNVTPQKNSHPANLSTEDAAIRMQTVLDEAGIRGWKAIVFEPMHATMAVNRLDQELKIRKGARLSFPDVQRLIVHEIETHIVRFENGTKQPFRLFCNSFPAYEATEEGLAVYNEERAGLLKPATLRKYAGRVLAANLALSHPFSKIFHTLVDELGMDMAFEIAARAKRGFFDTSQPGAHVKDLIYLKGFLAVKSHLKQHPDDYPLLFAGKIGLQHLPLVHSFLAEEIICLPTLLPGMLQKYGKNCC